MPYTNSIGLACGLSFCLVDDQPIFLDLRSDNYFMLAGLEAAALKEIVSGKPSNANRLSLLKAAGILEGQQDHCTIEPTRSSRPTASLPETAAPVRASTGSAIHLAVELGLISVRLRLGGLASLIDAFRRMKPDRRSPRRKVHRGALRFAASRRWIPTPPRCLPDSLALACHLARSGLAAELVLGVKLEPFAAHAWVQHENIVLNDCLDGALDFTPILVV